MQKINLLYVITKLELGGAQKQLLSLVSYLNKERYNVFLFTAKDGLLFPDFLSIDNLTCKKSWCLERSINPFKDLLALIEIYLFIKKNNIDIVHTNSSKAGIVGRLAARLTRVKIIIHTVHGWSFNEHQSFLKRKIFISLERICAGFTDKLIVVSAYDKKKGIDNHIGQEQKYHLIRYGINYKEFDGKKTQDFRFKLGINNNDLVVGMISCLKPQKSPQDFIKLAYLLNKDFPNARFLLVGDGVLREEIENLINNLGLQNNVILTGWCRNIPDILSSIDVFVLTSLWEGLPVSVLEAMSASLPVVATDTGGVREIIKDQETGFLVSVKDIRKLSKMVSSLLQDESQRKIIGQNAKSYLGFDFRIENMVNNTQELYENLIRAKTDNHDE